jgi:hypothetical protein
VQDYLPPLVPDSLREKMKEINQNAPDWRDDHSYDPFQDARKVRNFAS